MRLLFIGNFLSKSYLAPSEILADKLSERGFKTHLVSKVKFKPLRLLHMLAAVCFRRPVTDCAVVDVFSGPAFYWALLCSVLLKTLRCPVILCLHGGNLPTFAKKNSTRVRKLFSCARAIIAPSGYLRESLSTYSEQEIIIIPNGISSSEYRRNTPKKPFSVIWLRAFHDMYYPLLLVEAASILRNTFEEWESLHFTMVGRDKDGTLEKVQTLICEKKLDSMFTIIPGIPKERVPEILSDQSIFVNTTLVDNTPVSVIEAMASSCAVISTNVGGIPFLLKDKETALLIESGNVSALAEALSCLLLNEHLRNHLATQGYELVQKMDWEQVSSKWAHLIRRVT